CFRRGAHLGCFGARCDVRRTLARGAPAAIVGPIVGLIIGLTAVKRRLLRRTHCLRRRAHCLRRFLHLRAGIGLLPGTGSGSALAVARLALASASTPAASATAIARAAIFSFAGALLLRTLLAVAVTGLLVIV